LKKLFYVPFLAFAVLLFSSVGPPAYADIGIDTGFSDITYITTDSLADDPYTGDISPYGLVASASGMNMDFAAKTKEQRFLPLAAQTAPKGGGFFGADTETEYRPII